MMKSFNKWCETTDSINYKRFLDSRLTWNNYIKLKEDTMTTAELTSGSVKANETEINSDIPELTTKINGMTTGSNVSFFPLPIGSKSVIKRKEVI